MATEIEVKNTPAVEKKNTNKKSSFGTVKEADVIIYRLEKENEKLRDDTPKFPPYIRFPNTDVIQWNFGTEQEPEWGERAIRYLRGYPTIFVDEQEKNGRVVPENVLNNPNNRFEIINGEIIVRPHEKAKIQFLDYCNRNSKSPYRTGKTVTLFSRYSEEGRTQDLKAKQELQKVAFEKAFSADEEQIAFHAKYLGIPLIDPATTATRKPDSIITDYRQKAIDDPKKFIETYDDQDLKLKYKIERAIEDNVISLRIVPGKAVYTTTKAEICDVPEKAELKTVVDTLFLFSQGKGGTDLLKKLAD